MRAPSPSVKSTRAHELPASGSRSQGQPPIDTRAPVSDPLRPHAIDIEILNSPQGSPASKIENRLQPLERPRTGTLQPRAKEALQRFMDACQQVLTEEDFGGFAAGGFRIVRSPDGHLELSAPIDAPWVDPSLDPQDLARLPAMHEVFLANVDDVRAAIWDPLSRSGVLDYLQGHGSSMVDQWDILINVEPYFSRNVDQNGLHMDTKGETMFFLLLYCSDAPLMASEYLFVRPHLPAALLDSMEHNLPPGFVADVKDLLDGPADNTLHAPAVEPWGFASACDPLILHCTPLVHHRDAKGTQAVLNNIPHAIGAVFGKAASVRYANEMARRGERPDRDPPQGIHPADGAVRLSVKLIELMDTDYCVDNGPLESLLDAAGFAANDAARLMPHLLEGLSPTDPFARGETRIEVKGVDIPMAYPRGKELRREMSEKLEQGLPVHPHPSSRTFLRLWVMARPKV